MFAEGTVDITFADLLVFVTGADTLPPLGFPVPWSGARWEAPAVRLDVQPHPHPTKGYGWRGPVQRHDARGNQGITGFWQSIVVTLLISHNIVNKYFWFELYTLVWSPFMSVPLTSQWVWQLSDLFSWHLFTESWHVFQYCGHCVAVM